MENTGDIQGNTVDGNYKEIQEIAQGRAKVNGFQKMKELRG